ncbi:MAG: TrmH family RNA methyltransferase [Clostridia bacterium]
MKYEEKISYALGVFPTYELLLRKPNLVTRILTHDNLQMTPAIENLLKLASGLGIVVEKASHKIETISKKENVFVAGEFIKQYSALSPSQNHVVLDNPADMGNLGNIMRSMLGFNITNLALIGAPADAFAPKTVRASMGAVFSLNISCFDSYLDYDKEFGQRQMYCFLTDGKTKLQNVSPTNLYSLIFGNESSGLPSSYQQIGQSVVIDHSCAIDSLNLPTAVAIALYQFNVKTR